MRGVHRRRSGGMAVEPPTGGVRRGGSSIASTRGAKSGTCAAACPASLGSPRGLWPSGSTSKGWAALLPRDRPPVRGKWWPPWLLTWVVDMGPRPWGTLRHGARAWARNVPLWGEERGCSFACCPAGRVGRVRALCPGDGGQQASR